MARLVNKSEGFTIVEVAVTLVVIGIFMVIILSMQAQVSTISVLSAQQTKASFLAYNNMRRYANDSPPSWFKCNTGSSSTRYKVMEITESIDGLPGMVRQEVYASAPYGCKDASSGGGKSSLGMPVKVESIVEYGLPSSGSGSGRKVTHATYAAF